MSENEKFFLSIVKSRYIVVSPCGIVFNTFTKRIIGALSSNRYYKISCNDSSVNKIRHIQVHRLVYLVYKGDIPNNMLIHHKDENRCNNRVNNLKCVTHSENTKASFRPERKIRSRFGKFVKYN